MVRRYLELIQLRLGAKLRFTITAATDLRSIDVPTACILVLVENAVKHGIDQSLTGGEIAVQAHEVDGRLHLLVSNSGPAFVARNGKTGGLSNLQARLKYMYADRAEMTIETIERNGQPTVQVELILPTQPVAA
jgi:LytS/YehU family sensor histidine kinase